MSFRDNAFFRAVGAVTLEIEWRFWCREAWPWLPLPQNVFRIFAFTILLAVYIFVGNHIRDGGGPLDDAAAFLAFLLVSPPSPVYAFFRPTIRRDPGNRQKLRSVAECALVVVWPASILFLLRVAGKAEAPVIDLPIVACFLALSPLVILSLRAVVFRERMQARTGKKVTRVGAWSDRYLNSYFWDVCFLASILAAAAALSSRS